MKTNVYFYLVEPPTETYRLLITIIMVTSVMQGSTAEGTTAALQSKLDMSCNNLLISLNTHRTRKFLLVSLAKNKTMR